MNSLFKGFISIIFSCLGMGLSEQLTDFLQLFSVIIFVIIDAVGISHIWLHSRNNLWGVFYTFFPFLVIPKWLHFEYPFIENSADTMLISLEYSSILVLFGILGWWIVLLFEKIARGIVKNLIKKEGIRNLFLFF